MFGVTNALYVELNIVKIVNSTLEIVLTNVKCVCFFLMNLEYFFLMNKVKCVS